MRKNPPKKFKKTKHKVTRDVDRSINLAQKAVLDTLKYRQIFDCPMSYYQIWNFLISSKPVDKKDFMDTLVDLVKAKKILCQDGQYSLEKIDYEKAEKRSKHAEKLISQANGVVKYLKHLPWLEMVAITGSVSAFNANEQSDIDLLIVAKPKRLWLSRLFLVVVLKLLGVYWNAKKPAGTICPNILLTSDNLTWEKAKQNLYTANEVSLLYPLFFRHTCYFDFLHQNEWVSRYLPNFRCYNDASTRYSNPAVTGRDERSEATKQSHPNLLDVIELTTMKIQTLYMKNKQTTEIVSKDFVHFNIHDSAPIILKKFEMR